MNFLSLKENEVIGMNINFNQTKIGNNAYGKINPLSKGTLVGAEEKTKNSTNQGMKVVLPNPNKQSLVKEHVSLDYQEGSLSNASDILTDVRDLYMEIGNFDGLSEEELDAIDEQDYQVFKSDIKGFVSKEDMSQLDVLRNEAVLFEKSNDFKNADITWNKFDRILDKYEEFMPDDEFDMDDEMMDEFISEEDEEVMFDSMFENSVTSLRKQLELFQILIEKQNKSNKENKGQKKKVSKLDQTIKNLKELETSGGRTENAKNVLKLLEETKKLIQDQQKDVQIKQKKNENLLYENHIIVASAFESGNASLIDLYS